MKRLAVLGSPIEHSLSPLIHNVAYRELGIAAQYEKFEVSAANFRDFMESHQPVDWNGFSLTMPLKEIGLEVAGEVDECANLAGAINTLVSRDGIWQGRNTDISGFRELFSKFDFTNVSLLGAGGTARAALVALSGLAVDTRVFRRNVERDTALRKAHPKIEIVDWMDLNLAFDSELLINATPFGALEGLEGRLGSVEVVIDALYAPWPPPLFKLVEAKKVFSGKDLLVAQALDQIELFSETRIDRTAMFDKLRSLI